MTDSQYSQSQNPSQYPKGQQSGGATPPVPSPVGTKGGGDCDDPDPSKPPKKDPCDETEPIPDPIPCPPKDQTCPERPTPPWPEKPCPPPDPCADKDENGNGKSTGTGGTTPPTGQGGGTGYQTPTQQGGGGGKATGSGDTTANTGQGGGTGAQSQTQQGAGGANGNGGPKKPAEQLAALKKQLEADQTKLQDLEPLKAEIADIQQRIQSLEKVVDTQTAATAAYKDFYRATEVMAHEIECFIPTVRCQLDLIDKQKNCVCKAIATVDGIVQKARTASWNQKLKVKKLERQHDRAAADLEWTKKYYDFLKTDLQAQIGKRRDDLKALKGLADPTKDPCDVWFYLYELERLITPDTGIPDPAWQLDQTAGTYVKYWSPDSYATRLNEAIVMFNDAEANEKNLANQLAQAKKTATDLEKAATEAIAKRRDWIVKEIKTQGCCGPTSKCP